MAEESRQKANSDEPIWAPYIGKEIVIQFGNTSVMGVFSSVNTKGGYATILPSMVYEADDERVRIERATPTRITLHLIENKDSGAIIRPMQSGYLEARATHINRNADKKSGKNIGFEQQK